jgi:hypothetical protein
LFYGLAFTLIGVLGLCERASVVDPVAIIAIVVGLTISAWTSLGISTRLDIYRRQISELYSIIEELIDDKS